MLYIVEFAFTNPPLEDEWNHYYNTRKLDELLSVIGFRASQRFKAIHEVPAPYLAIHEVDSADVLQSASYRSIGGGVFNPLYRASVTNWSRNLFTGVERAAEVGPDECLVVTDASPEQVRQTGVEFTWLTIAGLDKTTERRGIAQIPKERGAELARRYAGRIGVYAPMTPQRRERAGKPSATK